MKFLAQGLMVNCPIIQGFSGSSNDPYRVLNGLDLLAISASLHLASVSYSGF